MHFSVFTILHLNCSQMEGFSCYCFFCFCLPASVSEGFHLYPSSLVINFLSIKTRATATWCSYLLCYYYYLHYMDGSATQWPHRGAVSSWLAEAVAVTSKKKPKQTNCTSGLQTQNKQMILAQVIYHVWISLKVWQMQSLEVSLCLCWDKVTNELGQSHP